MEILPKLTPTQALLLRAAARRADGRVIPTANLRGGARVKAMTALMRREWIEGGDNGFVLTDAGYAVAGRKRPSPPEAEGIQEMDTPDGLQLLEGIPVRNPAPRGGNGQEKGPGDHPSPCRWWSRRESNPRPQVFCVTDLHA
jgi:hypothetical protein